MGHELHHANLMSAPFWGLTVVLLTFSKGLAQQSGAASSKPPSPDHESFIAAANPASEPLASTTLPNPGAIPPSPSFAPATGTSPLSAVQTTIEVNAAEQTLRSGLSVAHHVTQDDVLSSAGTYGDFTRYLQILPGVVWNTDTSNDVIVRGGHPSENLYVVDGIEVPNINHIAVEGTTGGFTSMIDTSSISSVDMKSGVYDARYSSRLSSLIDVHTRAGQGAAKSGEVDLGISGAGGLLERPLGSKASLLLSGHRSVLNLFTNDIGINGVPIYTNGLARMEWSPGKNDQISALSLNGGDSISITPCAGDVDQTLFVDTQYDGLRSTDGLVWRHTYGPSMVSTLTGSYSAQDQDIGQQQQYPGSTKYAWGKNTCLPAGLTDVYQEQTHDRIANLGYSLQLGSRNWIISTGVTARLVNMNYKVAQPVGQQSPFNSNPSWTDSSNFQRSLTSGQSGTFIEALGHLGNRWTVIAGARLETFALTAARVFEPRASIAFRINEHQAVNWTFGRSAQLAPSINLLSYAQNEQLRPLQVEQFSMGADLWRMSWAMFSIESFYKHYSNEPVSTEYPSLMLANMVDTLGQQFVWLPLKSAGSGQAQGVEFAARAQWAHHLQFLGSVSGSSTRYAALDGVMRPGNYDFPLVANGMASVWLPKSIHASLRDTYASGRPFTPFIVTFSEQQDRGVYDLTKINALRGPAYNRLDIDMSHSFRLHNKLLNLYGGLENTLNRENFLGYAWLNRLEATCGSRTSLREKKLNQMPIFPSFGLHYTF
jgi:hypothetical protein